MAAVAAVAAAVVVVATLVVVTLVVVTVGRETGGEAAYLRVPGVPGPEVACFLSGGSKWAMAQGFVVSFRTTRVHGAHDIWRGTCGALFLRT